MIHLYPSAPNMPPFLYDKGGLEIVLRVFLLLIFKKGF